MTGRNIIFMDELHDASYPELRCSPDGHLKTPRGTEDVALDMGGIARLDGSRTDDIFDCD